MYAIHSRNINLVDLLLRNNANPNIQKDSWITALIFAIDIEETDIAKLLIDKWSDPLLEWKDWITAIWLAIIKVNSDLIHYIKSKYPWKLEWSVNLWDGKMWFRIKDVT